QRGFDTGSARRLWACACPQSVPADVRYGEERPGGVWDDLHIARPVELNEDGWDAAPVIDAPGRNCCPRCMSTIAADASRCAVCEAAPAVEEIILLALHEAGEAGATRGELRARVH